jgi:hypothetical protein
LAVPDRRTPQVQARLNEGRRRILAAAADQPAVTGYRAVAGGELAEVRAAVAAATDAVEQLTAVVEIFATRALKEPRLARALLAEPADRPVDGPRLRLRREFRDVLAEVVAGGVRFGSPPRQDPEVVATALVGAIAEALLGPLSAGADTGALAAAVPFTHRAVGAGRV